MQDKRGVVVFVCVWGGGGGGKKAEANSLISQNNPLSSANNSQGKDSAVHASHCEDEIQKDSWLT